MSPALAAEAGRFLAGQDLILSPRLQWPQGIGGLRGRIPEQLRLQPGRALATLGGPGWGPVVRELLASDGPVPDELLDAVVRVLGRWDWPERPGWVTFVPSRRHPKLVQDLAERIADVGRLPLHLLERTREARRSWRWPTAPTSAATSTAPSRSPGPFHRWSPARRRHGRLQMDLTIVGARLRQAGAVLSTRWSSYGAARTNRSDCWLPVIPYSYGCTTSLPRRQAWGSHHGKTTTEGNRGNAH